MRPWEVGIYELRLGFRENQAESGSAAISHSMISVVSWLEKMAMGLEVIPSCSARGMFFHAWLSVTAAVTSDPPAVLPRETVGVPVRALARIRRSCVLAGNSEFESASISPPVVAVVARTR